jgi:hypothetical protein
VAFTNDHLQQSGATVVLPIIYFDLILFFPRQIS